MKRAIIFLIAVPIISMSACNDGAQNEAVKQARQIQAAVKQATPGTVPTSENGYYMRAKINGKEWIAKDMLPNDKSDSRRILGENNGEAISFSLWMRGLKPGHKESFSEDNAVDLFTNDDVGIWGGRKGELTITKIDDNVVEGSFYFTGSTARSDKTVEVTDGFFRTLLSDK